MNIKAAAVCALVMLSSPAAAQGWGPYGPGGYGAVGFHEIRASLRAHGLRPMSQPVLSGRYVVIRAIDRDGLPVRVLLSARFGDVVDVRPLPSAQVAGIYEPRPFRGGYKLVALEFGRVDDGHALSVGADAGG